MWYVQTQNMFGKKDENTLNSSKTFVMAKANKEVL